MDKIICITSRNIINSTGELRLIKNRTIALENNYDIVTDFYALVPEKRLKKEQEPMENNGVFDTYILKRMTDMFSQGKLLAEHICAEVADSKVTILLSGYIPLFIIKILKKRCPHIIFYQDIHGTVAELLEYGSSNVIKRVKARVKYYLLNRNVQKISKIATKTLVVSEALKDYCVEKYNIVAKDVYVIPCGGNENEICLSEYKKNREIWRNNLKIYGNCKLFVYSGGVSPWQSIEDTVELYKEIKKYMNCACALLIMSGNPDSVIQYEDQQDNIFVRGFQSRIVPQVLCAADIGLLLRNKSATNAVAFPNKFYEYLSGGLYIINTPNVRDQYQLTLKYDLGMIYDGCVTEQFVQRMQEQSSLPLELRKSNIDKALNELCFENTVKLLAKELRH